MAVTPKALIEAKQAENAQTTQYTAASVSALIDKFTVTNTTGASTVISVNLVPSGDAVGASNLIIDGQTVPANSALTLPELSGHVLEIGDLISTLASAAASLTIRCSGREVT